MRFIKRNIKRKHNYESQKKLDFTSTCQQQRVEVKGVTWKFPWHGTAAQHNKLVKRIEKCSKLLKVNFIYCTFQIQKGGACAP